MMLFLGADYSTYTNFNTIFLVPHTFIIGVVGLIVVVVIVDDVVVMLLNGLVITTATVSATETTTGRQ